MFLIVNTTLRVKLRIVSINVRFITNESVVALTLLFYFYIIAVKTQNSLGMPNM